MPWNDFALRTYVISYTVTLALSVFYDWARVYRVISTLGICPGSSGLGAGRWDSIVGGVWQVQFPFFFMSKVI